MASQSSARTSGSNDAKSSGDSTHQKFINTERGDSDSTHSTESTSSTERDCKKAKEAAERARTCAVACRKAEDLIGVLVVAGDRNNSVVSQKMSKTAGSLEHNVYLDYIRDCGEVRNLLEQKVFKLRKIVNTLEQVANALNEAADRACELANETSIEAKRTKFLVCWATNSANSACDDANVLEYSTLRSIRKYNRLITTVPNIRVATSEDDLNEYNAECHNKTTKTRYALAGSLVVGVVLLSSLTILDFNSESFVPILTTGVLLVGFPLIVMFYKLYRCWKSERKQNSRRKETRAQMRILDVNERLSTLEEYFREKNIQLPPCS